MKTVLRIIVVAVIALVCSLSGSANAMAHTALLGSDPADGATTSAVPTVVTLTFTDAIKPAFATVVVNGTDGRNWVSGPARATGQELRVPLRPDISTGGAYEVGYRVVSADGHPVTGSITFTIAPAPGAPEPTTLVRTTPAPTSSGPLGADSRTSVITAAVAGLLIGGGIAFWQSRRHRRKG